MKRILEICVDSIESALIAESAGADRIELCQNMAQGGTTPSPGLLNKLLESLSIPVFVLVRPRPGDFLYSMNEFGVMRDDIRYARESGAHGIVTGVLLPDGRIDDRRLEIIRNECTHLPMTFHRAFDMVVDPFEALETLIEKGVERVLTSGQRTSAAEGKERIEQLIQKASDRIQIVAGGGIRPANCKSLLEVPGLFEFHSSASEEIQSKMIYRGDTPMGRVGIEEEFRWHRSSPEIIRQLKDLMITHPSEMGK